MKKSKNINLSDGLRNRIGIIYLNFVLLNKDVNNKKYKTRFLEPIYKHWICIFVLFFGNSTIHCVKQNTRLEKGITKGKRTHPRYVTVFIYL